MLYKNLQQKVSEIVSEKNLSVENKLTQICELLQTSINYYDWVGFYFSNHEEKKLYLKAYAGETTDHTIIPFGKGICGQVAVSNQNFVVEDVAAQDNYIACSINVKAEIVIPLFKEGKNVGQIDIDSNTPNPFTEKDERFLEWVNELVSTIL